MKSSSLELFFFPLNLVKVDNAHWWFQDETISYVVKLNQILTPQVIHNYFFIFSYNVCIEHGFLNLFQVTPLKKLKWLLPSSTRIPRKLPFKTTKNFISALHL